MDSFEARSAGTGPEPVVTVRGPVPAGEVVRAVRGIARVLRAHAIDCAPRVRLTWPREPGAFSVVQANLPLPGAPGRVQACGPAGFAVTFALERLDRQLLRWRHARPQSWPEPVRSPLAGITGPRPIVRRKQVPLFAGTSLEAVRLLGAMDYDCCLFADTETGVDALVHRDGPAGLRLTRQDGGVVAGHGPRGLAVDGGPAPRLTEAQAAARLCRAGLPFLFCTDPATRRGMLLYRRYDGDLAVLVPVPPEPAARGRVRRLGNVRHLTPAATAGGT
ncbi:hypothetical protein [Nocardia blacklockiae]|uniref:hypothetical protein n=1 Tax=Nocardia blacklockiae TaxID=480036 RepID=UPI001893E8F2|nr:hypothetical protein [Nocardia blacklockiae]MBF6174329.1 hypothetical protein [Nocardia blacklockiae]